MNYKIYLVIKLCLLFVALCVTGFLIYVEKEQTLGSERRIIFLVDSNKTMNTQDVLSGESYISRLDAAKYIITDIVDTYPGYTYGLVLFNATTSYLVPSTFDVENFLLYVQGMSTSLLPDGKKDFALLDLVFDDTSFVSYVVLSDFDTDLSVEELSVPTSLIGIGSLTGGQVRYSNGARYFEDGVSLSSIRNDSVARVLGTSYMTVSHLDAFSSEQLIFEGMSLPMSQRIVLYILLGVLVILAVML